MPSTESFIYGQPIVYTIDNLGCVDPTSKQVVDIKASAGDRGTYIGPMTGDLNEPGWHYTAFGDLMVPAHESMFKLDRQEPLD